MERIARALELAHSQLERRKLPESAVPEPMLSARVVRLSPELRISERLLPANAGGVHGAPYKLLRTQVLQRLDAMATNTLAILSPAAGDGKTLTAINLSIAIAAELGRTALLVDFDLRRPSVHRRLGFMPEAGVEDCLQAGRPIQDVLVRLEGYERLAILPARASVPQSSELLSSQRAVQLLTEIRGRYANRVIIVDLPPVLQADDALAFSRLVQAGLMVVGDGRTKREDLARSMQLLTELPLIGTVLNGSNEPAQPYY